jgi:hypothetical protein
MCAMTLSEYLEKIGKRRYIWACECGLSKDAVYRHTSGKPVNYETAELISEATGGAIAVIDIYKTGRKKK